MRAYRSEPMQIDSSQSQPAPASPTSETLLVVSGSENSGIAINFMD